MGSLSLRCPIEKRAAETGPEVYFWIYRTRDELGNPPEDLSRKIVADERELEAGAARFMSELRSTDVLHIAGAPAEIVSSFVITDETAKALKLGDGYRQRGWIGGAKFRDPESKVLQMIRDGELPEVSLVARHKTRKRADGVQEMYDLEILSVGFVDQGDNRVGGEAGAPVLICKRAEKKEEPVKGKRKTEDGEPEGGGGDFDLKSWLAAQADEGLITSEQLIKFLEQVKTADAPATPEPSMEEMTKRAEKDPAVALLLKRAKDAEERAKRVDEVQKRLDERDDEIERGRIAKRLGREFSHLPESDEDVAEVLHELRRAVRHGQDDGVIAKSSKDKPDVADRIEAILKAMDAQVDASAMYGERGHGRDVEDDEIDLDDRRIPAGDRVEAAVRTAIEESHKRDPKNPIGRQAAMDLVMKRNPKLMREYLGG